MPAFTYPGFTLGPGASWMYEWYNSDPNNPNLIYILAFPDGPAIINPHLAISSLELAVKSAPSSPGDPFPPPFKVYHPLLTNLDSNYGVRFSFVNQDLT
jgi:hypothetical protein